MKKIEALNKIISTYNGEFPAVLVLNSIDAYDIFGMIKPDEYEGFKLFSSDLIEKDIIYVMDKKNWDRITNQDNSIAL